MAFSSSGRTGQARGRGSFPEPPTNFVGFDDLNWALLTCWLELSESGCFSDMYSYEDSKPSTGAHEIRISSQSYLLRLNQSAPKTPSLAISAGPIAFTASASTMAQVCAPGQAHVASVARTRSIEVSCHTQSVPAA